MFMRFPSTRFLGLIFALVTLASRTIAAENPYLGIWELTLPGPAAGWLEVSETGGQLHAEIMWIAGSVVPVESVKLEPHRLALMREHVVEHKDASGKMVKRTLPENISITVEGDQLKGLSIKLAENMRGEEKTAFTGKRSPPVPPAPNLAEVRFGPAVKLFNGKDLTGWRLTDPKADNGWSVQNGLLVNKNVQIEGQPHKHFGNLRTDYEFDDFNLTLEVRYPEHGNSGIYLRGIYEVQVEDNYGQPATTHSIGSIYSRIKPTTNPCKPAGQWQSFDITFHDRHVTVILNGTKVIDNQPVLGCTGGALWSDVGRPGPIYLQGDHTSVEYRNIVLRPITGRNK
jgi:hypothetical protein